MNIWTKSAQVLSLYVLLGLSPCVNASDPLPSWNDGATKAALRNFVAQVTQPDGPHYVRPQERIAVFDNDGTLWAEQPAYFQLAFALDRVKALSIKHPQWNTTEPFRRVLQNERVTALSQQQQLEIMYASHSGMTTEQFSAVVAAWLATARHPTFKSAYTDLAYQPMLELLQYLRAHGFKTFIVSGGGVEFMRVFAEQLYGVAPEQVIGSSGVTKYEINSEGQPVLMKEPKLEFINDGAGKPSAIHRFIGRRPILAFGNSDGDLQMLQWTAAGVGPRFVALIHHTDAEREFAYDRQSANGHLDRALDEAIARKWTIVDMRRDWRTVFRNTR